MKYLLLPDAKKGSVTPDTSPSQTDAIMQAKGYGEHRSIPFEIICPIFNLFKLIK